MTEEQVTKAILSWLSTSGWEIVCFDFPQSGTGKFLHPDDSSEKNKDSFNPDIVATKDKTALFFENKNRYYQPDFKKVNELIIDNKYKQSIADLLNPYEVNEIYYGIGMPVTAVSKSVEKNKTQVDFIVGVDELFNIECLYIGSNMINNKATLL